MFAKRSERVTPHVQVSYMILQRVSPVTHSIGNCLKRVIVIVASVVIFQNQMSQKNILGAPTSRCSAASFKPVQASKQPL